MDIAETRRTVETIVRALAETTRVIEREVGAIRELAGQGKRLQLEFEELVAKAENIEKVVYLFNTFAEASEKALESTIEELVSRGLSAVFQENVQFNISHATKAGRVSTSFTVQSRGIETSIFDARGGGLVAVAGFLLRLVMIVLQRGRIAPILVLDEPFAHLSEEFQRPLANLMRRLSSSLGIQIILVTHSTVFGEFADAAYEFAKPGDHTIIASGHGVAPVPEGIDLSVLEV